MTHSVDKIGKQRLNLIMSLRNRHFFAFDVLALSCIPALALTLRLDDLAWSACCARALIFFTLAAWLVKIPIFYRLGLYRRYWRYASVSDLATLAMAVGLATLILGVLFAVAQATLMQYGLAMYRSVPLIDGLLTGLILGGARFGVRGLHHRSRQCQGLIGGHQALVVGASEAGTMAVREMRANPQLDMEPVAFVDEDPGKMGTVIEGLQVVGSCSQAPQLVNQLQIQQIIIAVPTLPLRRQREIIGICEKTGLPIHTLPGIYELLAGHKTVSRLPKIDIHQLLHREPVSIDPAELAAHLAGKTVLVTGAGGSIGGELCRQLARFKPAGIILLGHGENSIAEIGLDLGLSFPNLVTHPVIADVRDLKRVDTIIQAYRPDVIFHAAAHKHIPLMEASAEEAITNNVLGTQSVLRAAEQHGVPRFVLISSDKAVNPTSVMGATKRMAELLVVAAARRSGRAYMAVRFGNVLGSRGSVIPVFQRQIAAGGPLTITHPDMCRYFMTIPEAVQLVLQAAVLGQGGEVFVLDMGQPVRILDLATDLIKLSGLEPGRDIKIVFTGIRPGEKLCEELFLEGEAYRRTSAHKIFRARPEGTVVPELLERLVLELADLAQGSCSRQANERMRRFLPEVCYYIDNHLPRPRPSLPEPVSPKPAATPAIPPVIRLPSRTTSIS